MVHASVLVAVDLPIDISQLEPIIELAHSTGWPVHLLHVMGPHVTPALDVAAEPSLRGEESIKVEAAAIALRQSGLTVVAHTIAGPTVEVILEQAEAQDSRLIAIVGHKHHLAHRITLGSVESTLLKVTDRPVLVLPASDNSAQPVIPRDGLGTATDRLIEILERTTTDGEFEDLRSAALAQRNEPESEENRERLSSRLQETLERFESGHPTITRAINDVAYYLSGLGL